MSQSSDPKLDLEHAERDGAVDREKSHDIELQDASATARLTRKFDLHIIPWLFGIWLFAFIDRSNIGNAKIDGLTEDLGMDGDKFNIALMVFYIPYILVDVPSNWLVKRVGAGVYLPVLIIGWGLTSTFLGFTKSYGGLLAARVVLGFFEGGLLGGIVVYLAMFYTRFEMLWRIGLFYIAAPLSGAFGGLLATGLARIHYNGYDGWPWIFFIEGIMTVVFGAIALYFLPDTPNHSKFLNPDEKVFAMARLKADFQGLTTEDDIDQERFDWHWVRLAVKSPLLWLLSLAWLALLVPLYAFSLFIPSILRAQGYSIIHTQLLTVPPYVVATLVVLISAWFSDRITMRGPFIIGGMTISMAGFIMLLASDRSGVKYAGTFFAAAGVYPCSPLIMGWLSNNTAPHYTRATAVGLQIAIANCAAFIATFTYVEEDAPDYELGHSINIGACALAIAIVSVAIFYCKWENSRREQGHRNYRLDKYPASRLGHDHPNFRLTI